MSGQAGTEDDRRPTNGERYASAVDSSDLRLRVQGGDLDVIIAAGMVRDGMATALYRLTVEYDAQRGPIDEARRWVAAATVQADALRKEAAREASLPDAKPERVEKLVNAAERGKRDALATMRTEYLLALASMKTLREARDRLWDFALDLAERKRVRLEGDALGHLTGRVLDAFLDPNCPHCDGRGSQGGGRHEYSGPLQICKPCKGIGSRRLDIGRTHAERLFAGALAMAMDAQMYEVQRAIGKNRRLVTLAKERIAQALA